DAVGSHAALTAGWTGRAAGRIALLGLVSYEPRRPHLSLNDDVAEFANSLPQRPGPQHLPRGAVEHLEDRAALRRPVEPRPQGARQDVGLALDDQPRPRAGEVGDGAG